MVYSGPQLLIPDFHFPSPSSAYWGEVLTSTQLHFDLLRLCLFRHGQCDSERAIFGFSRNFALIYLFSEFLMNSWIGFVKSDRKKFRGGGMGSFSGGNLPALCAILGAVRHAHENWCDTAFWMSVQGRNRFCAHSFAIPTPTLGSEK